MLTSAFALDAFNFLTLLEGSLNHMYLCLTLL